MKGILLAAAALILFLYAVPWQTQDGPNHKRVALILSRLDHSPAEAEVYKSNLGWIHTNEIFPLLYQPLASRLSTDTYEKIFVGFFLVLLIVSYHLFLRVWSPQNHVLWVLMLPFWFHPLVMRGFYNFVASLPFALLALAALKIGIDRGKKIAFPIYGVLCWLVFLSHPFPLVVLVLVLFLQVIIGSFKGWRPALLYAVPPLCLVIPGFFASFFKAEVGRGDTQVAFMWAVEQPVNWFVNNFVAFSIPHLIAALPFFLLLPLLMVHSIRFTPWREKIFWFVLLIAFFYSPVSGGVGSHLNERFLPFVWAFLPVGLVLKNPQIKRIRLLAAATVLLMGLGTAWGMSRLNLTANRYREALQAFSSSSRLYPILFDHQGPAWHYAPLYHFWALMEPQKVVFTPYLFASSDLFPLSKRTMSSPTYFPATSNGLPNSIAKNYVCGRESPDDVVDCAYRRRHEYDRILRAAAYYDYWLISDPPGDFVKILETKGGLTKVSQSGEISLWHLEEAPPFVPPLPAWSQ